MSSSGEAPVVLIQSQVALVGLAYGQYAALDLALAEELVAAQLITFVETSPWSDSFPYMAGQAVTGPDGNYYVATTSSFDVAPVGDTTGSWTQVTSVPSTVTPLNVGGVFVTGVPAPGMVLTATSPTTAVWQFDAGISGGGAATQVVAVTSTYTASPGDIVVADATAAAFTVTLPAAGAATTVWVKKVDAGTNAVTVVPAFATTSTIDGATSVIVGAGGQSYQFTSDGLDWYAVASTIVYGDGAGTAAAGDDARFGTATVVNGVTVSGTPDAGQVLTATSSVAANWSTPVTPSPVVIDGVTVGGTPSAGQALIATGSAAASWATLPSGGGAIYTAGTGLTLTGTVFSVTAGTYDASGAAASAVAAIPSGATAGTPALRALGTTSTTAAAGNDSRFGVAAVVSGVTVSGTPTTGQVLTATGGAAASWTAPAAVSVIAGVTVSGTPSTGQVLTATGSSGASWATAAASVLAGVTVSGTPSSGQVLTATGSAAADWATPAGSSYTAGTGLTLTGTAFSVTPGTYDASGAATAAVAAIPSGATGATPSLRALGTSSTTAAAGNDVRFGVAAVLSGVTVSGTPSTGQVLTATASNAADWETPPAVTVVSGITVSGTPTAGQVLTATSGTAADWATPAGIAYTAGTGITLTGMVFSVTSGTYDVSGAATAAVAAIPADAATSTASLRTLGTGAQQAAAGTDSRFGVASVVSGVTVSGTPSVGQVLVATSASAADWATPVSAVISGVTVSGTPSTGQCLTATGPSGANWQAVPTNVVNGVVVSGTPSTGQSLVATGTATATWSVPPVADIEAVPPAIIGLLGWAFDPYLCTGGTPAAMVSGSTYYIKIMVPQTITISNVCYIVQTAGATLTIHECFGGLFSSAGTQLSVTPDLSGATYTVSSTGTTTVTGTAFSSTMIGGQYVITGATGTYTVTAVASSTSLTVSPAVSTSVSSVTMVPSFSFSATGEKIVPLLSPQTIIGGPAVYVYAALLMNGTTPPAIQRSPNTGSFGITFGQAGTTVGLRSMRSSATTTTMPSSFTPGAGMNPQTSNWAGVS